jgi:hypothetical protein
MSCGGSRAFEAVCVRALDEEIVFSCDVGVCVVGKFRFVAVAVGVAGRASRSLEWVAGDAPHVSGVDGWVDGWPCLGGIVFRLFFVRFYF